MDLNVPPIELNMESQEQRAVKNFLMKAKKKLKAFIAKLKGEF